MKSSSHQQEYAAQVKSLRRLMIAFVGVSAITLGLFLIPLGKPALDPADGIRNAKAADALNLRPQTDHPVTESMQQAAQSLNAQSAPAFSLPGTDGGTHTLESLSNGKPLVLFFIEKNCPCCLGAEPSVDALWKAYQDRANVVGVINADMSTANTWRKATNSPFLVLADPQMSAIKAYKAERGVYTTLIAPGGKIVKAYPGYSKAMLKELSEKLAAQAGVPARTVNLAKAPDKLTSGCAFPDEPEGETK